jgi:hypothetical protein
MTVTYQPRILWPQNPARLPDNLANAVTIPSGLSREHVRAPMFVDAAGMMAAAQNDIQRPTGWTMGTTNGRVARIFEPHFANQAAQWRRVSPPQLSAGAHGPCTYRFTGGDLFLDLTLRIYILNTCMPDPNEPLTIEIFAAAYSHELLHVLDEVEIVCKWLTQQAHADQDLAATLGASRPYVFGAGRQTAIEIEQNFPRHIQTYLRDHLHGPWVRETNRRNGLRDTPDEYQRVDARIQELRARLHNPHPAPAR